MRKISSPVFIGITHLVCLTSNFWFSCLEFLNWCIYPVRIFVEFLIFLGYRCIFYCRIILSFQYRVFYDVLRTCSRDLLWTSRQLELFCSWLNILLCIQECLLSWSSYIQMFLSTFVSMMKIFSNLSRRQTIVAYSESFSSAFWSPAFLSIDSLRTNNCYIIHH